MRSLLVRAAAAASLVLATASAGAVPLVGGTTTVTFDSGFLSFLTTNDLTPTSLAPSPSLGVFPITGASATLIDHSGGIEFTGASPTQTLSLSNFIIDLAHGDVTGTVVADGHALGTGIPLFLLVPPTGHATAGLDLSPTAIGAIDEVFGTTLSPQATVLVGEATVRGPSVPEPSTLPLAAAGFVLLAYGAHRRR